MLFEPIAVFLSFFLHGYGAHQDLHSFPTRRSSDLWTRRQLASSDDMAMPTAVAPLAVTSLAGDESAGDRKSTRLNSSHGYISYAVFCLKKKKNPKACCRSLEYYSILSSSHLPPRHV